MKKNVLAHKVLWLCLAAVTGAATMNQEPLAYAQEISKQKIEKQQKTADHHIVNKNVYILGPGDSLEIEVFDIPELSGIYSIGPGGNLYVPRLRELHVEGLTVEELRDILTEKYKEYIIDPQVYVRTVSHRPIRIYVRGEVVRPGFYTLGGSRAILGRSSPNEIDFETPSMTSVSANGNMSNRYNHSRIRTYGEVGAVFPRIFDALREAQGITPYTDLSKVEITRKNAKGLGGGQFRTELNLQSLVAEGDETHNIRLFDGDIIRVGRSEIELKDQLIKASQSNLSPQFINVYISGQVIQPGIVVVPHGANLTQAIATAGGPNLLHGRVEFVRFARTGKMDRRVFKYDPNAGNDDYRNPILMNGDVIRIRQSVLSATSTILKEITAPAVGIYSLYSLTNNF